ncbi:hypothetical protein EDB84DRAFT_329996 [Lactarius hengduanensis]|nr:hypothetical protein EDB84DRAFT_329996 [Lactarius hengduanensis]
MSLLFALAHRHASSTHYVLRTVRDICKNSLFLSSVLCLLLAPNCRALSLSYSFESLPKVLAFSLTWVTQRASSFSFTDVATGFCQQGSFWVCASIKGGVGRGWLVGETRREWSREAGCSYPCVYFRFNQYPKGNRSLTIR